MLEHEPAPLNRQPRKRSAIYTSVYLADLHQKEVTMPSSKATNAEASRTRVRQIAREAADRYIATLASQDPAEIALAETDLLLAVTRIHDALIEEDAERGIQDREDAARHAGFILALEIGRRMAGGAQ